MKKLIILLITLTICSYAVAAKGPVRVGSKIDTEGSLLGYMIFTALNENGFKTVNKIELGPTNIVRKAITGGQIDIYPEYTGNGAYFFKDLDSSFFKHPGKGYEAVKEMDKKRNNLIWLKSAPANNTWAIATRKKLAKDKGIKTLEDFAEYVNNGGRVKLAASEEFVSRPDTLKAFQKTYGFNLSSGQLLIFSGGNTIQTEKAAALGTDGVNFAMAYGTDGQLAALGLTILDDTKNVQPIYEPAPVVRGEIFDKYPEIADILNPIFTSLNREKLQSLNAKIAVEGMQAQDAAVMYLKSEGFIK